MKLPIYMDNHATTPVDPRVLAAMLPYFQEHFGNASSHSHAFGWRAKQAVDEARQQVAALLSAKAQEIIFTSGATESNNLALKGASEMYRDRGNHIITSVTEHKSVLDCCRRLEKSGFEITYLPVDGFGCISLESIRRAITSRTILISIMAANNEIGAIQPIAAIGEIARENGILFHTDAAQTVGKIPLDVEKMGIDLLSFTGHKLYAPKGVGALFVRSENPSVRLVPLLDGGGHEGGLRSGTLNVPGIVGLGEACRICLDEMPAESARLSALRDKLQAGIFSALDAVTLNGYPANRLPHNLNITFDGLDAESLMLSLSDIALSTGSACRSAGHEASYVLKAIGLSDDLAHSTLRFGLGRFTTEEEVNYVLGRVVEAVRQLRDLSPARVSAPVGKGF
ncbi:MAG: IscS subfamily cysteine desulfurase [Acidobacteria bacterium RIFCSPLOWO2_12_FULL_54_10]|nr:MAG: IscS subfamily cysteine desulfurase [Acidobacteria bacterium RIFCSPLOWO2_12_FULL_54_10]